MWLLIFLAHVIGYWGTVMMMGSEWHAACATRVLKNQFVYTPLVAWALPDVPTLPAFPHLAWQLVAAVILTDILFYPLHRLAHTKYLYRFHAMHHEFHTPIPMAALYAGPVEHVVVNLVPPMVAGIVCRMDTLTFMVWAFAASVNTVWAHAVPNQHTDHHRLRKKNYGVGFMLMDRWMGTLATS